MTRERSIDLFILFMNVIAIMVLVGILSVMVTSADAGQSDSALHPAHQAEDTGSQVVESVSS